uniref:ECF transporter S component n=1 Tax=Anaerococcus octavius TaxID=54007 RepID=UPI003736EFB7
MNKKTLSSRKLVTAAVLGAITIVLGMTPLGLIPLGIINATTMHIPVIIAAIVEGPVVGALVGLIFGVSSLVNAIVRPNPVSFVFYNPLISIIPRILIGITSYYSYRAVKKLDDKNLP